MRSRAARSASVGWGALGAPRSATAARPVSTRGRPVAARVRSTGTMALLIVRTVGVRFGRAAPLAEPLTGRASAEVTTFLRAFIGAASRARRPCDLLRGEDRALATDSLRAFDTHHRATKAGAHGTAHCLFHRNLQECLAAGRGGPERIGLTRALLASELGHAKPVAATGGELSQPGEHGLR